MTDRYRDVVLCENRPDRDYDEQSAASVTLKNGTIAATFHRELCGVLLAANVTQWTEQP